MILSATQLQQAIDGCKGQVLPDVSITSAGISLYAYVDNATNKGRLTSAYVVQVEHQKAGGKKCQHTVAFIYFAEKDKINLVCGDKFLEGTLSKAEIGSRIALSIKDEGGVTPALRAEVESSAGAYPVNDNCDFPSLAKAGTLCLHARKALSELKSAKDLFDRLMARHQSIRKASNQAILTPDSTASSFLETYAFKVPVLYEGDQGSGKTWEAMSFATANGYPLVLIGGNAGMEASDLLGYNVPYRTGELVWKDGPMARAFRMAAKGAKVVLLFDEIARIPAKQLSLLLTALTPFAEHYSLPTGRMLNVHEGVGEEEVLRCPVESLCVIGTTNVGAEFLVEDLDPAILERFVIRRKDTELLKLTEILREVAAKKAFPSSIADGLIKFYQKALRMKASGLLLRGPSTRILVRCVELSRTPAEVRDRMQDHALLWVGRDLEGRPIAEQLTSVAQGLRECLP